MNPDISGGIVCGRQHLRMLKEEGYFGIKTMPSVSKGQVTKLISRIGAAGTSVYIYVKDIQRVGERDLWIIDADIITREQAVAMDALQILKRAEEAEKGAAQ
jgi:hypothetical protein